MKIARGADIAWRRGGELERGFPAKHDVPFPRGDCDITSTAFGSPGSWRGWWRGGTSVREGA